jgi:hypothetical protein
MNDTHTHDHDWAVQQLTAYSVGMLPEAHTLRLEEHLRACEDCRARLAPLRAGSAADVGHLPASLIATWPRASRLLSGMERGLVESHLRSCEACRRTLAFAGHEPVLSPEAVAAPARTKRESTRRIAWSWALGLSGAAAAAAAWLLVVQPALFHVIPGTSATMGSLAHRTSPAAFELAVPAATPGAFALPEPAPAAAAGATVLEVGGVSAGSGLVVRVPVSLRPAAPSDGERRVTLTLMQGVRELAGRDCRFADLGDAVRIRPEQPLPAGDYELRVTVAARAADAPAQAWTWTLRVR